MKSFNVPYNISKFKYHDMLKSQILNALEDPEYTAISTSNENIARTDWNIPNERSRSYVDILKSPLNSYLEEHYKDMGIISWEIHNYWFQQYTSNGFHNWHSHPNCHYTNVYYVEMPNKKYSTEILDPLTRDRIIALDVEEGDIVSFPSFIFHRSPKIEGNERKTIIAFNSSILTIQATLLK